MEHAQDLIASISVSLARLRYVVLFSPNELTAMTAIESQLKAVLESVNERRAKHS